MSPVLVLLWLPDKLKLRAWHTLWFYRPALSRQTELHNGGGQDSLTLGPPLRPIPLLLHTADPRTTRPWTVRIHIYAGFFYRQSALPIPGFASADSTNRGWKTVFSGSQPQFPNRELLVESRDAKGRLRLSFWGGRKLYADFQPHEGRCS